VKPAIDDDGEGATKSSMNVRTLVFGAALCCALFLMQTPASARQGAQPKSRGPNTRPVATVQLHQARATDPQAEIDEDNRVGVTQPLRFAARDVVQIMPQTHGTWENVAGGRLWRLRVHSAGATDLNFGFARCRLTEGSTLHILAEGEDYYQGPYGSGDNKAHGEFWTPLIPGDRAVIELFVPDGAAIPDVEISSVNRGYRDMFRRQKNGNAPKAGACNIDVVCPQGDPWRNEIRSVATYSIGGVFTCTGTLITDANNDQNRHYFLTADHCGVTAFNAASVVVYWNFQSPNCGQHGGGSLAQNQLGTIFRMSKFDVDVTLLELDEAPSPSFNVYYSGWDRSGAPPSSGVVGIHHPNTDEKSISFCNNPVTTVNSCIGTGGAGTHWNVVWSSGVTEPGSSGSGIWDATSHRLIGTLSGGGSSCFFPFDADCYGKFSYAWNSGATANTRLRDWLDPNNTGVLFVNGRNPGPVMPPVTYTNFVLGRDFSTVANPNGVWSYGWKTNFSSTFGLLSQPYGSLSDNGLRIQGWILPSFGQPAVYYNSNATTAILGSGQGVVPPGTAYFHPGLNNRPEQFGVIRFVAPSNSSYRVEAVADSLYSGSLSGDTDFHVLKNGLEIFGVFLDAGTGTSYSNLLSLAAGEPLEFVIGRGADNNEFGAGLKTEVTITPVVQAIPTAAVIVGVNASLLTESCTPTNRAVDPGELVSVSYTLRNIGTTNGTVTATLLPNSGVIAPSPAQNYGVISTNGTSVARTFSFTAGGTCGGIITNRLQLQVNGTNGGIVTFTFNLGTVATRLNERFDSVRPPALPTNWSSSASGASSGWATTAAAAASPTNSVFAVNSITISDAALTSPPFLLMTTNSQLAFLHRYQTEAGFDGGVLEYSVNNGPYTDFIAGGGRFIANGYNATLDSVFGSPLAGREVWSGDSTNFVTTIAAFPPSAAGHYVRLRWRLASDSALADVGWYLDTIQVTDANCCAAPVPPVILHAHRQSGSMVFSYDSRAGQTYFIEYKDNLNSPAWLPLRTELGDGSLRSITNAVSSMRFYRIRTL
jgi:hypothetical protein